MTKNSCPYCGHVNIEGVDECEACGQSLTTLSKSRHATDVEKSILKDPILAMRPRKATVVPPDMPVAEVLDVLARSGHGIVVVAEDDKPVGIFSERDALLRLNVDAGKLADHPISEFMTPNPEMLSVEDRIAFALNKMAGGGYRHVPIVDEEGRVTGIISVRDILRYTADSLVQLDEV